MANTLARVFRANAILNMGTAGNLSRYPSVQGEHLNLAAQSMVAWWIASDHGRKL